MNRDLTLCPPTVAVGVAHDAPTLPRFLIEPNHYGFVILDTMLGQHISQTFTTPTAAHLFLMQRFAAIIEQLGVRV